MGTVHYLHTARNAEPQPTAPADFGPETPGLVYFNPQGGFAYFERYGPVPMADNRLTDPTENTLADDLADHLKALSSLAHRAQDTRYQKSDRVTVQRLSEIERQMTDILAQLKAPK